MKRFFKIDNILKILIIMVFSKTLKFFLFFYFGITLPIITDEPLNVYRIIHTSIVTVFTMLVRKWL